MASVTCTHVSLLAPKNRTLVKGTWPTSRPRCPCSPLATLTPSLLRTGTGSALSSSRIPSHQIGTLSSRPSISLQGSSRLPRLVVTQAGRGDDIVVAGDRIIAATGYLLPFLDGVKYGRYLYLQYPFARALLDPIVPLVQLYNGIPFAGFVAFFLLYLGVIQNPSMSRYVRYNVMQAVVLDILMILPALFERAFSFKEGVGFQLTVIFYNTVFLYLLACFLFGVGSCLLGKNPRLPIVADAADAQVPY